MAENRSLSKEEAEKLRLQFEELYLIFENDPEEFVRFKVRPLNYLRRFGLEILKYFNNSLGANFVYRFTTSIRNFLRYINILDRCSWCKIKVLIVIYAVFGKSMVVIDRCFGLLSSVIDSLKNMMDLSKELAQTIVTKLEQSENYLNSYILSKKNCKDLGYCP